MSGNPVKALWMGRPCSWTQNKDQKPGVILRCFYCFPLCLSRTLNNTSHWAQVTTYTFPLGHDPHVVRIFFYVMIQDFRMLFYSLLPNCRSVQRNFRCLTVYSWSQERGTRSVRPGSSWARMLKVLWTTFIKQLVCQKERECRIRNLDWCCVTLINDMWSLEDGSTVYFHARVNLIIKDIIIWEIS